MTSPPGWTATTLGQACHIVGGSTPRTSVSEFWGGDIPWITPDDLSRHEGKFVKVGSRSISDAGFDSTSTHMLPAGAVLFSSRAPIGYVAIAANPVCTNQGFKSLIPPPEISSDYLYWYMRYITPEVERRASGTTFKEVSKRRIAEVPFAYPSLGEQERIVSAIESQLETVFAGRLRLADAERASVSLEAAMRQSIADPGAEVRSLGALRDGARYGTSTKCSYDGPGIGVIRIPNVVDGVVDPADLKKVARPGDGDEPPILDGGDVVFVRTNGSRELIGRAGVVGKDAAGLSFASYLIRYRFRDEINPAYVALAMSSPSVRRQLVELAASSAGQYNLSIAKLDSVQLPVPSYEAQIHAVGRVTDGLAGITRMRGALAASRRKSDAFERSTLKAQFEGKGR